MKRNFTISVLTADDTLWTALRSVLEKAGWKVRLIETLPATPDQSIFFILDGRNELDIPENYVDTPILWITGRDAESLPEDNDLFRFFEIICLPIQDFELIRRLKTLQSFAEFAERSKYSEILKWKKKAYTDPITGLYNYRYFKERLAIEIRQAEQSGEPVSLIFCDVNQFKALNDRYGHPAGDNLLQEVGCRIRQSVRKTDILARYAGDEFVLILPSTNSNEVQLVARKIEKCIEATDFKVGGMDAFCSLTISVGVASYPYDANEIDSVIRYADKVLLNAKIRNKIKG